MTTDTTCSRDASGRFRPGCSGNPAGRPRGMRNVGRLLAEALDDRERAAILRVVVDRALAGDAVAARFCVDRLVPRLRGRPIPLDLPEGTSPRDVLPVYDAALSAMVAGEITPEEAADVAHVLAGRKRALQAAHLQRRLAKSDPDMKR